MPGEISTPAPPKVELKATLAEHGLGVCAIPHPSDGTNSQDSLPGIVPLDRMQKVYRRHTYEIDLGSGEFEARARTSFILVCPDHRISRSLQYVKPGLDTGEDVLSVVVRRKGRYVRLIDGKEVSGQPQQGIAKLEIITLPPKESPSP